MNNFTAHVGEKFHSDGSIKYFPGTTIVSPLEKDNPMFAKMLALQSKAKKHSCSPKFSFLPPRSFHMTVFVVYNDLERYLPGWSTKISPLLPVQEVNRILLGWISSIPAPEKLAMQVDYVDSLGIKLIPANNKTKNILQDYRDAVSTITGIRYADHAHYHFHMTFAYPLIKLTTQEDDLTKKRNQEITEELKKDLPVFSLNTPRFCSFSTMEDFIPLA